ncbi:MAG TPA: TOBE domain-containing protein, partial [Mycobacteriales bacterium]|nr:TOBE domain-containing protein [Mycobacteriales bacterium]
TVIRDELRRELRALQRDTELTTVLVTHDPAEAILLAREVIVLQAGEVLQAGPIGTVLAQPASAAVARLVGIRNVHEAAVGADRTVAVGPLAVPVPGAGVQVSWCIRPERIELTGGQDALVHDVVDYGPYREVQLEWAGTALIAHTDRQLQAGQAIGVRVDPADVIVWPRPVPSPSG